jgi:uncharacterized phage protein (TIGR02218 family)
MTYDSLETSAHDGGPLEGFRFVGTSSSYHYTNAQQDITINGILYQAAFIKRSGIKSGSQEDSYELEIELPFELQLAQDYAYASSPPTLDMILYRYHEAGDPATEWIIAWVGSVTAFSVSGKIAKLRVPSVFEAVLSGNIPSVYYQGPCNHVLYDSRCGISRAANTTTSTVQSITDSTTIVVVDDGVADGVLVAGELNLPVKKERRQIISNTANTLVINFPFFDIEVGDEVEMAAGCDHAYQGDCKTKFSNTLNYGGFPYIPNENPFEGNIG